MESVRKTLGENLSRIRRRKRVAGATLAVAVLLLSAAVLIPSIQSEPEGYSGDYYTVTYNIGAVPTVAGYNESTGATSSITVRYYGTPVAEYNPQFWAGSIVGQVLKVDGADVSDNKTVKDWFKITDYPGRNGTISNLKVFSGWKVGSATVDPGTDLTGYANAAKEITLEAVWSDASWLNYGGNWTKGTRATGDSAKYLNIYLLRSNTTDLSSFSNLTIRNFGTSYSISTRNVTTGGNLIIDNMYLYGTNIKSGESGVDVHGNNNALYGGGSLIIGTGVKNVTNTYVQVIGGWNGGDHGSSSTKLTIFSGTYEIIAGASYTGNVGSSHLVLAGPWEDYEGKGLKVNGTVVANDIVNNEEAYVEGDGLVKLRASGIEKGYLEATRYMTTEDKAKIYNYVSFDSAVAKLNEEGSAVKEITVLGWQEATKSATIPADATVVVTDELDIGEKNGSDVRLEFLDGAKLKGNGEVYVMGTLFVNNKNDVRIATASIYSDVYAVQMENGKAVKNGWAKWTNVFTAMSEAQPGDVIEVTRESGKLRITQNMTIPAGVTLMIGTGKAPMLLSNGVTLTVNGVLDTYLDVYAERVFGTEAKNAGTQVSSCIVVNGLLKASKLSYGDSVAGKPAAMGDGAPIAGVYFAMDGRVAVSTLAVALGMIEDISSDLKAYGPVTAGDETFVATEKCKILNVTDSSVKDMAGNDVATKLTVGTLTLSGSTLNVMAGGAFSGTVMIGDNSLVAENVTGFEAKLADKVIGISGAPAVIGKSGSVTVSMGTAKANNIVTAIKFVVSAGATLNVATAMLDNLVIDGTVSVTGQLDSKKTTVNAGGKLSVFYDETGAKAAGIANVAVLNLGIAGSTYTGAEAAVSGPVTVTGQAFVAPGAVIDAVAQEKLDMLKSTAYYVEEKLLMTVYDATGSFEIAKVSKITVTNAYFDGTWKDSKGAVIASGMTIGSYDKVYANVVYDIYKIVIKADQGVDDVYLNGMQMSKGMIYVGSYSYYAFFLTVKAGEYEVTYNLANGYAGEAKLYAGGTAQAGNKFTATGTPEDSTGITMEFQLSGIQKSGYVDPTEPDKKSGLTITEILLIVLVVLVVIMAVIVALRLMRS